MRGRSREADWMIPPIRRSSSAFGAPRQALRLSLTSALGPKVLPKGPKVGRSATVLCRNRIARTLSVLMDLGFCSEKGGGFADAPEGPMRPPMCPKRPAWLHQMRPRNLANSLIRD